MTRLVKMSVIGLGSLAILAASTHAAFPGTNGKIAYVCTKGAFTATHNPQEICTVKPGGTPARLTTNDVFDLNPAFSADGTKIAFERGSNSPSCASPGDPCGDIYRMRADGSGVVRLTNTPSTTESDPSWSPDGKRIAYAKNPLGANPKIVVMRASDGAVLRTLGTGIEPDWSPNGRRIAFAKRDHLWCVGANCVQGYGIYTMSAGDGSGKTMLTSTTNYADGTPCNATEGCPETNGNPNWTPNGASIAWDIFDSQSQEGYIYRMNANGSGKSSLVPSGTVPGCPQHPAFSPDQTQVVFSNGTYCASGGNPPSIYVRSLSGGAATNVAAGFEPDWGPKP